MKKTITTHSEKETEDFARQIAKKAEKGDIYLLTGTLGAGKTAFTRAFIQYFLKDEEVPSPTFTLVQTYETEKGTIWHFDLYRLKTPDEIWELGMEDALRDIALIEWPEKIKNYNLKKAKEITFTVTGENTREITYDQ